jgi:hypothetical protein
MIVCIMQDLRNSKLHTHARVLKLGVSSFGPEMWTTCSDGSKKEIWGVVYLTSYKPHVYILVIKTYVREQITK